MMDLIGDHAMKMKQRYWCILMISSLLLFGCGSTAPAEQTTTSSDQSTEAVDIFDLPKNEAGYVDISVDQLSTALEDKDFTMVNVHIPYDGELPQTDAFIPYNEIESHLDELPADKDARLVLYCRSGSMSADAAHTLTDMGYTNIIDVQGGMRAWEAAGQTLIRE
jgi:rhodanese-related sulfurtransferase